MWNYFGWYISNSKYHPQVIFLRLFCLFHWRQSHLFTLHSFLHISIILIRLSFPTKNFCSIQMFSTQSSQSLSWASNDRRPLSLQAAVVLTFMASLQFLLNSSSGSESMCWDLRVSLLIFHIVGIHTGVWEKLWVFPKVFPTYWLPNSQ